MASKSHYRLVNGVKFAPWFPYESCLSALNYKPLDDDIFVVTYPKNGTTWTLEIVNLLLNNGRSDDSVDGNIFARGNFLEYNGSDSLKQLKRPFAIKTHIDGSLHWNPHAKYIIVLRNPKDVLVSFYYHHTSNNNYGLLDLPFSDFFDLFMNGEIEGGSYFDWVLSWWQRKDFDNVLVTIYEDRIKDPASDVIRIAKFLNIVYDEDIIKRTVETSSIGAISERSNRFVNFDFFRKGIVGDWRNHVSDDQNKRLEEMFHEKFDGTGLENLWNDSM